MTTDHTTDDATTETPTLYCTWCGDRVDTVYEPNDFREQWTGHCDEDGIVYLTATPGDSDA